MKCLQPIWVNASQVIKDHFGVDKIQVPCGHCEACLENRAKEWFIRLSHEVIDATSCFFVTLTYDDEHLPYGSVTVEVPNENGMMPFNYVKKLVPVVKKEDFQKFMKRLRKRCKCSKLRYYAVSEYGPTTFRPHFHAIIFNLPTDKDCIVELISDSWQQGFVKVDPISDARIRYDTYYVHTKTDLPDYLPKPFALMSRRPAIGHSYYENETLKYYHQLRKCLFVMKDGFKYALPRLYKKKIFNENQLIYLQLLSYERKREDNERTVQAILNWYHRNRGGVSQESPWEASERKFREKVAKRIKKRKDI